MAITPPIMTYPLGTDYYDVEVFNENWKNTLTHTDMLFENGVGADVLGYIEDGATHTAGTVWLSKFNKGEFKCLTTNTDNYIDVTPGAEKWFRIDDLTNGNKLYNLSSFSTTPLIKQETLISSLKNQIAKTGNIVTVFIEFTVSANVSLNQNLTPLFVLPDYILPATDEPPRGFVMPIVVPGQTGSVTTIYELFINRITKNLAIGGHIGTRDLNLIPGVYYQINCSWATS